MKVDSRRNFTPYAFGCVYYLYRPSLAKLYPVEEIATTFYTPKSKPWGLFIEGYETEKANDKKETIR
jgi:hypothetical protein